MPTEVLRKLDLPQSSIGAPLPHVFADEGHLLIAYLIEERDPNWDGTTVRILSPESEGEPCALLRVNRYLAFQFGPPNDEAIHGHQLYCLGIRPYSSFEVLNSAWLDSFEVANRVHPHHNAERYNGYRHVILTFHDTTLEFIAKDWSVQTKRGSVRAALLESVAALT